MVFQGNQAQDENFEAAMYQEMGSAPATMEASKSCDFYSLLPGLIGQQSDAESAYTQSKLSSVVKTWVRIPLHEWPEDGSWNGIADHTFLHYMATPTRGGIGNSTAISFFVTVGSSPCPTGGLATSTRS